MKTLRPAILAVVLAVPGTALAIEPAEPKATPQPPSSSPGTSSHSAIVSPRDSASGQATGKRQHKPIRLRTYYDQAAPLNDGRLLLVNTKTGEHELGDASQPDTPPLGQVLPNGTYKMKDGTLLVVKAGLVLKYQTPTPTPFLPNHGSGVPVLR